MQTKMNKISTFFLLLAVMTVTTVQVVAEPVTPAQINDYAKQQYRNQWKNAALSIMPVLKLDDEGGYTYTATLPFPDKDPQEIYARLRELAMENTDTILSEDAEHLLLVAQSYYFSVSNQVGGFYRFHLCLRPTITFRAEKGEARIEISLQYYEIVKTDKGVVNMLFKTASGAPLPAEQWLLADRYPYNERGKMPLATAEAFTKSYAFIQLLMKQLR